jgi:hypothetical protein
VKLVGAVGGRTRAQVDERGGVMPEDAAWTLDWWIGADDRWRVPAREVAVRQRSIDDVPVVETAMRVPSGDAVQRIYGVGSPGEPLVIEFENASPAPFVVALVVRGARTIALDGVTTYVDGRPTLFAPRAPSRWSCGRNLDVEIEVCSGSARTGAFASRKDRAGRLAAAFLHPVAHRTTLRCAVMLADPEGPPDLPVLPSATDAARGWVAQLGRGLRCVVPDEQLMAQLTLARAELLLAASRRSPDSATVAALEDWGFDADAAAAWPRLRLGERRRAGRRSGAPPTWAAVRAAQERGGAGLLLATRALLALELGDEIDVLSELPPEWSGRDIEVNEVPTKHGPLSYAVRWHGPNPALLWEGPDGVTLRAPGLDPTWSTDASAGETLLVAT